VKYFWESLGADTLTMSDLNERIRNHQLNFMAKKIIEAEDQGWTMVICKFYDRVPNSWPEEYLSGKYICMGHYWYFEKPEDATYFALRWS